jgi:phosphoglycerate kinase
VTALSRLLDHPKPPFVAVIGGLKLSTKLPVIEALCRVCDEVLIGGAMATAFFKAKKMEVGKSAHEKEGIALTKRLLKCKGIRLPEDVVVTSKVTNDPVLRRISVNAIGKKDMIVDVGPNTLKAWAEVIGDASTIVWNGPIGLIECAPCGFGSRFLARTIGARAKGKAFGVAGGGDTLPVIGTTKTEHHFDFVSTGGGAMLDFIAQKGKLPGLLVLLR